MPYNSLKTKANKAVSFCLTYLTGFSVALTLMAIALFVLWGIAYATSFIWTNLLVDWIDPDKGLLIILIVIVGVMGFYLLWAPYEIGKAVLQERWRSKNNQQERK